MLRHRVIPLVLLDGYSVVKTIQFDIRRNLGNPIVVSRIYNNRNVDELVLLDIDAAKEGRSIDSLTVSAVAKECFMPLTVGGGLRSCDDIAKILASGADKVSLNAIIHESPDVIFQAVSRFGSQCIIASIDIKHEGKGNYRVFSHAGKDVKFSLDEVLELLNKAKVGEVLLNSVDHDGVMDGYDIDLINYVSLRVNMPLIVAGGASKVEDCTTAINNGASAVAAASIFHFTSITPKDCKDDMFINGISVRL